MKKTVIGIVAAVLVVIAIIAVVMFTGNKKEENKDNVKTTVAKLETVEDMTKVMNDIYEKLGDKLPAIETRELDITDEFAFTSSTGLKSNENVESVVVSEPFISSQAYSVALVKVSENADIEEMKQEMLDNIDTRKWICVSAEKVYVTNVNNVIFLIMSDDEWAKPVYDEFKEAVGGNIGKELERTEEI